MTHGMASDQQLSSRLSGLPDSLKAKILLALGEPTATPAVPVTKPVDGTVQQPQPIGTDRCIRPGEQEDACPHLDLRHLKNSGFTVVDGYLSPCQVQEVLGCAEEALSEKQRPAGMGGSLLNWKDPQVRGDVSRWLHVEEEQQAGRVALAQVLERLAQLKQQLLEQGFEVDGKTTYQLACYPGGGSRYVTHADRSHSAPTRRVTALLYLNPDWDVQAYGGQLALYLPAASSQAHGGGWSAGEPALLVAPLSGRLLLFDSLLEHEVLPSQHPRWAITVWFHCSKPRDTQDKATSPHHTSTPSASPMLTSGHSSATAPAPAHLSLSPSLTASLLTPTSASLPRIFVSIAAYRDPETQWTILDLFAKAAHPERVYVGVVWQVDPLQDTAITAALPSSATTMQCFLQQVREVRIPAVEATGPCKARALSTSMWAGEEYCLQIDSHMRFVHGWDEICVAQLLRAEQLLQMDTAIPANTAVPLSRPSPASAPISDSTATAAGTDTLVNTAALAVTEVPTIAATSTGTMTLASTDIPAVTTTSAGTDIPASTTTPASTDMPASSDLPGSAVVPVITSSHGTMTTPPKPASLSADPPYCNAGQQRQWQQLQQQQRARGAVLTTYPPDYLGNGAEASVVDATQTVLLCASGFDERGMLRTRGRLLATDWESTLRQHLQQEQDVHGTATSQVAAVQEQVTAVQEHHSTGTSQSTDAENSTPHAGQQALHNTQQRPHPHHQQEGKCDAKWEAPSQQKQDSCDSCLPGQWQQGLHQRRQSGDPLPCVGWAAGFSFSRAAALIEHAAYPPPNELPFLFMGEETYQYARLWTHGYECFSPGQAVCFHQWARSSRAHTLNKDLVSESARLRQSTLRRYSQQKVSAVLGAAPWPAAHSEGDLKAAALEIGGAVTQSSSGSDSANRNNSHSNESELGSVTYGNRGTQVPSEWQLGGRWGLGTQRTLQELTQQNGLDLAAGRIFNEGVTCCWLPPAVFQA